MPIESHVLKSMDLFQDLTENEIEVFAASLRRMRVIEGENLTRRGETAHTFYIVLSGNYMIYFQDGRAFTIHNKGNIIGMSTVLAPFDYRGTTVALTDGEVLAIPGDKFLEQIQSDAEMGEKLMGRINEIISERLRLAEAPAENEEETVGCLSEA